LGHQDGVFQITVNELPDITTTGFSYARLGNVYSAQLTATGTAPIIYNIVSGSLPVGLEFHNDGSITGTPLATGTFNFTVVATNAAGDSIPKNFSIDAGLALAITTAGTLRVGTQNVSYGNLQFSAEGIDTANTVT